MTFWYEQDSNQTQGIITQMGECRTCRGKGCQIVSMIREILQSNTADQPKTS